MSKATELPEITKDLGEQHATKSKSEAELKRKRADFFSALDDLIVQETTLATKTVELPSLDERDQVDINEWMKIYHPGWLIKGATEGTLILEENPALKKYAYINRDDGKVYQRILEEAAPSIDDERLAENHPELWLSISRPIPADPFILGLLQEITGDDKYTCEWVAAREKCSDWPRQVVDLEEADIDPEDSEILGKYFIPGQIKTKLASPRKAKPEEIDGTDNN
jgi:hypothetical protein